MGEKDEKECPAGLHGDAKKPSGVGNGPTERGGGKPVLVSEGQELGELKESGGEKIEGKNVAAGQKFEGVDEKNEGTDIEEPEGGEGEAEGEAELEQGRAEEGGDSAGEVEGTELQWNDAGEQKKGEGERDEGGDKVGAAPRQKKGAPIKSVGEGTKKDGVERAFANLAGDLKIVIGGRAD